MDANTAAALIGAGTGVLTVSVAVGTLVARPLRRLVRNNDEFRDDWYGRPARPGVHSQPGVMERLSNIEYAMVDKTLHARVDVLSARLETIERAVADDHAANGKKGAPA